MDKKKRMLVALVCVVILLLAWSEDHSSEYMDAQGRIVRQTNGDVNQELSLTLNAGDVLENYPYELTVRAPGLSQEEANVLFEKAIAEIDESFCPRGEDLSHVTGGVALHDSYVNRQVAAEWFFSDYRYIDTEGIGVEEHLPEDGQVLSAEVLLTCGGYEQTYQFGFVLFPREKTEAERLLSEIEKTLEERQESGDASYLELPSEINGVPLTWEVKEEHLVLKVLLLEAAVLFMLPMLLREQQKSEAKKREQRLMLDYPDLVSKLTILVGSGMSIKQAWHKISAQYLDKREKNIVGESDAYEEMVKADRELWDGESERVAYQRFGERTGVYAYHRLVRLLVQNLQKGNQGLCELLEEESEAAFLERTFLARKLGEEAGTKLLLPMILMMGIIMVIVIMPAIMNLSA